MHVEEIQLPGIGVRHDFTSRAGTRIGVITLRSGEREVVVFGEEDPDQPVVSVRLEEEEVHGLIEILGGSDVAEELAAARQKLGGAAIDWLHVEPGSYAEGRALSQLGAGDEPEAVVAAVIAAGQASGSPAPDHVLHGGDVVVLAGSDEGVARLLARLRSG